MRATGILLIGLGLGLGLGLGGATGAQASTNDDVVAVARSFLDAYARGDRDAVLARIDPQIVVYGSDAAEVFRGRRGVGQMLEGDQKLWRGPASIGAMQELSVVRSGPLSAMTFQAPFGLAGRPAVLVRFSMVWRREAGEWRLVQSANSTPTVGQSAEALLKETPP